MLTLSDLNKNVIESQYAVRGPIVDLAQKLDLQGKKKIWYFNIGNPQQLGQPPLSYAREILSLINIPTLLSNPKVGELFHEDLIERAKFIMQKNPVGIGAYTLSAGMMFVREAIAQFIEKRDNITSSWERIFLTDGASKGVDLVLQSLIRSKKDGILIPIPQYPLYSADITLFGGSQVPYHLDEENEWRLAKDSLEEAIKYAQGNDIIPRVIVIINPNNPTGSLLTKKDIEMVLDFALKHKLSIIADEVYQENIYYPEDSFHSFAKVANEKNIDLPIFSLHSTSKGFIGECGYRGGYLEIRNVSNEILTQLLKVKSIGLCSNTAGQLMTYLMVTPPEQGEASFDLYQTERKNILESLGRKSRVIADALDSIDGIYCRRPRGAMYLFPRLDLPDKDYHGKPADFRFCEHLVNDAGIVTVPGSGFGQKEGTFHLRMTFLPPEDKIPAIMEMFKTSYKKFLS